ncbi:hypothetical protein BKA81DRAFT_421313 [Phyllosticta paracitricarpa]
MLSHKMVGARRGNVWGRGAKRMKQRVGQVSVALLALKSVKNSAEKVLGWCIHCHASSGGGGGGGGGGCGDSPESCTYPERGWCAKPQLGCPSGHAEVKWKVSRGPMRRWKWRPEHRAPPSPSPSPSPPVRSRRPSVPSCSSHPPPSRPTASGDSAAPSTPARRLLLFFPPSWEGAARNNGAVFADNVAGNS